VQSNTECTQSNARQTRERGEHSKGTAVQTQTCGDCPHGTKYLTDQSAVDLRHVLSDDAHELVDTLFLLHALHEDAQVLLVLITIIIIIMFNNNSVT
jgi:hypothetical protein